MSNKSPVVASSFEAQMPAGHRLVEIAREPVELYKILNLKALRTAVVMPRPQSLLGKFGSMAKWNCKNVKKFSPVIPSNLLAIAFTSNWLCLHKE